MDKDLSKIVEGSDAEVERVIARMTRRSFTTGALAAAAGAAGVGWVVTRPLNEGIPWPLRKVLGWNESVARSLYSPQRLAPTFPDDHVQELRVNGMIGLAGDVDLAHWSIRVTGRADRNIPLAAVLALPVHEMVTEFKCVEGWSRFVRWKGVRLADFLAKFGTDSSYVGLSTPGSGNRYYVSLDRASAEHPQTLLCFEMNNAPLTVAHGAPLRLVSTLKYGIKCIKRIGVIELSNERPPDYWAERGYDWYAGL